MEKQNIQDYIEYKGEKFTKRVIFNEEDSTVFILNFQPGQTLPTHKHPGATLFLLVLKGEGSFIINGNELPVKEDDLITITGDEELSFTNNGNKNVSLYVTLHHTPSPEFAKDI